MQKFYLLISVLVISGCTTHNQIRVSATEDIEINNLAIIVPDTGVFEVQDARLRQDGTSTVLFGVVGYAVEAGYRESADVKKSRQLQESIDQVDCAGDLANAVAGTFEGESDIQYSLYRRKEIVAEGHDARVTFKVKQCGFTLVNQDKEAFVPFIHLNAKAISSEGRVIWDDNETFTGKKEVQFETMLESKGIAKNLLDELFAEAGARLAYQLIYQ